MRSRFSDFEEVLTLRRLQSNLFGLIISLQVEAFLAGEEAPLEEGAEGELDDQDSWDVEWIQQQLHRRIVHLLDRSGVSVQEAYGFVETGLTIWQ